MKKFYFILSCFLIILSGCSKFKGGQSVPSYIQVDTIGLTYSSSSEVQCKSAKIIDAWVYVDDNLIGAFELPATFPVLSRGKHKITVRPGVLLNGLNTTREKYPFYTFFEQEFLLTEDSITKISNINVEYRPSSPSQEDYYYTKFAFKEDFEDANSIFDTINGSATIIERFRTSQLSPIPPQGFYEEWVGKIELDKEHNNCQVILRDKYEEIPDISYMADDYKAVFLEIDYCSSDSFYIGTRSYYGNTFSDNDFLGLYPTNNKWNKVYVNLTNRILNDQLDGADGFKIYIVAELGFGKTTGLIYLDNIRLLHFKK